MFPKISYLFCLSWPYALCFRSFSCLFNHIFLLFIPVSYKIICVIQVYAFSITFLIYLSMQHLLKVCTALGDTHVVECKELSKLFLNFGWLSALSWFKSYYFIASLMQCGWGVWSCDNTINKDAAVSHPLWPVYHIVINRGEHTLHSEVCRPLPGIVVVRSLLLGWLVHLVLHPHWTTGWCPLYIGQCGT